ncbi:hypothetical protein TKK_0015564 [Trichogramma kaykai]
MPVVQSEMYGEVKLSVSEAMKDPKWKSAMLDEYESLIMQTWVLVNKPKDARPLTCRWVFCLKEDGRYKARLVVRGFEQTYGQNYFDVFSPVARHTSVRLILSIAASENMKVMNFDVKTAFLHGDLEEQIFMFQPEGFSDKSNKVCLLKKSLYGLKQAPRNWNGRFTKFLKSLHFEPADDDPCVYYDNGCNTMIVLHVDDGLMVGRNPTAMIQILKKLNKEFKITFNSGKDESLTYIGMQIKSGPDGISINQSRYAERILQRYKFTNLNPANTPMERGMCADADKFVNNKPLDESYPYREMIKRVLQYVKETLHYGIHFNGNRELVAYCDSDFDGDEVTGKSTTGVIVLRGGPLVWITKKQPLVANSTAEAEYRAAVAALDEISWIRRLAHELQHLDLDKPTPLSIDNRSAIHMLENTHEGKVTKGKKHIEISRKFIQQHIGTTVNWKSIRSEDQLADFLTKPLSRKLFENLIFKIIKEEC